ncbi:hypothetical protein LSH36_1313g00048 [Paralvinella palmiformis]|uniref:Uncharacterized protein n=1 Tax=Paralvinella palmiformis TaxID=53620 RepID=A0AAD9MPG7_9ANNE|nr:hypothetical protein LSH36_1313g00048 [Paralvinella palmiformis]
MNIFKRISVARQIPILVINVTERQNMMDREPNRIDWYNGETYCSQNDIQGDIAYSYLDDDTLINYIINFVNDSKVCVQLWLGVRNRIWFWIAGKFKKRISQLVSEKSLITHER